MNTNKVKFSIITPVYNSFNLMENYFKSLEQQKYKNFEVIIIDDCSTDNSYNQLIKYKQNSKLNMKILKTETNSGPGNARNIGIGIAKGEWITFIDNDDWVDTNILEKVEKILVQNQVNCIIYDYYITNGKKKKISHSMYSEKKGLISISDCIISVRNHTIGKFYKLSYCRDKNINFPKLKRCEDVAFVCRAIDACGSVYYMKEAMYYYYQRSASLSNNKKIDEGDMIKAFNILEDTLENKYPNEIKEKSVLDLLYGVLLMMCKAGKSNIEIQEYIKKYEEKYPDWYLCEILHKIGKPKYIFLMCVKYKMINILKILSYIHTKLINN